MSNVPDNMDDIIDSRDVIKRIEELQGERESLEDDRVSATSDLGNAAFNVGHWSGKDAGDFGGWHGLIEFANKSAETITEQNTVYELKEAVEAERAAIAALKEWDDENTEELDALVDLQDQCEGYCSDWRSGAVLIRETYFEDYAQQFAEDIGAIDSEARWPNNCIDWEAAARELRMDYTSVEFDGITYLLRS
jgi:antirestriction protein